MGVELALISVAHCFNKGVDFVLKEQQHFLRRLERRPNGMRRIVCLTEHPRAGMMVEVHGGVGYVGFPHVSSANQTACILDLGCNGIGKGLGQDDFALGALEVTHGVSRGLYARCAAR